MFGNTKIRGMLGVSSVDRRAAGIRRGTVRSWPMAAQTASEVRAAALCRKPDPRQMKSFFAKGPWLCKNVLAEGRTVYRPTGARQHTCKELFRRFSVGFSPDTRCCATLGRSAPWNARDRARSYPVIAATSGLVPTIFMTREIVREHMQRHLAGDVRQRLHQEVRRAHARLDPWRRTADAGDAGLSSRSTCRRQWPRSARPKLTPKNLTLHQASFHTTSTLS
jgi:hypothetical protein